MIRKMYLIFILNMIPFSITAMNDTNLPGMVNQAPKKLKPTQKQILLESQLAKKSSLRANAFEKSKQKTLEHIFDAELSDHEISEKSIPNKSYPEPAVANIKNMKQPKNTSCCSCSIQ